ncbi:MAG: hypothetical protein IKX45_08525 [Bacteroidales bacterium]|nr:hypothetical protein [Bacteroidales bacterium]
MNINGKDSTSANIVKIVRIPIARRLAAENFGTVQESGPGNVPFAGQTGFEHASGPGNVPFAGQMTVQIQSEPQPEIHKADDPLSEISAGHCHLLSAAKSAHRAGWCALQGPTGHIHPLCEFWVGKEVRESKATLV